MCIPLSLDMRRWPPDSRMINHEGLQRVSSPDSKDHRRSNTHRIQGIKFRQFSIEVTADLRPLRMAMPIRVSDLNMV